MILENDVRQSLQLDPNDESVNIRSLINTYTNQLEKLSGRLLEYRSGYTEDFRRIEGGVFWPSLTPIEEDSYTIKHRRLGVALADAADVPAENFVITLDSPRVEWVGSRDPHPRWPARGPALRPR